MAKTNTAGATNHLGLVKMRVQGEGTLLTRALTLSNVRSSGLPNSTLVENNEVVPTLLANFTSQYMQLDVRVIDDDEWFRVKTVTPFLKPVATSLPG